MVQQIFMILALLTILPAFLQPISVAQAAENNSRQTYPERAVNGSQSVLIVNPREIDLGSIGPGEESKGVFYLKNTGAENLSWSTDGPEGWTQTESHSLSATAGDAPQPLKIHLIFIHENGTGKSRTCSLVLRLEYDGQIAAYRRDASLGNLRGTIRLNFQGGSRVVFFQARLAEYAAGSMLEVKPLRIDFGTVRAGEQVTRRVLLTNRGRETLRWRAGIAGMRGLPTSSPPLPGRYVSFQNEAVASTATYLPSTFLRDVLELSGVWGQQGGYPVGQGEQDTLRYRFAGTGISLFLWKTPVGGPATVFIDDQFVNVIDSFSEYRELAEISIAEGLLDGAHTLTVVNQGGRMIIEGVRLLGKPIQKGPRGWLSVFPDSGTTTRETDYINVVLNTNQILPGIYGDHVFFVSKGSEADVEIFVEVAAEQQSKFLDVHRYVAGSDYFYITNPRAEANRIQAKGYVYLGIAFRLFSAGTPGTTEFLRWFNPTKGDHFYSHDPTGGGKALAGYLFEGSIGNIATSRLAGTRELYRWFNPAKGTHFYTTDQGGEGLGKKGYRFDGIAGFVR